LCNFAKAVFLFDIMDVDGGGDGFIGKQEGFKE
jgi:hypothetical protein